MLIESVGHDEPETVIYDEQEDEEPFEFFCCNYAYYSSGLEMPQGEGTDN